MCHPNRIRSSNVNIAANLAEALIESGVLGVVCVGGHVSRDTSSIGPSFMQSRALRITYFSVHRLCRRLAHAFRDPDIKAFCREKNEEQESIRRVKQGSEGARGGQ